MYKNSVIEYIMFLSEDKITEWVNSVGGLLITRRISNIRTYGFANRIGLQYVCLTGYPQIIQHFFQKVIQKFNSKIVLIIIESDVVHINAEWLEHPQLQHCFAWNKPFHHHNISALPIGLNYNRQYDAITNWLSKQTSTSLVDTKLLCMNYSPSTDPSRVKLIEYAKHKWSDFCTILDFIPNTRVYKIPSHIEGQITVPVTNPECYTQWSKYKFVISPRGAGEDCHRTWETIHIGCIPIVLSSNLNELYHDLPILVVDSWDMINRELLEHAYIEIENKKRADLYNMKRLTTHYWINRFQSTDQHTIRKIHFITYGNHTFEIAKRRLLGEAHEFGEFTTINGYGPSDLTSAFQTEYKDVLDMRRGGGYWLWKLDIIRQSVSRIRVNEILVYLDAGCRLNIYGRKRFREYIDLLYNSPHGILSFQMSGNNGFGSFQCEKAWTTKEIFEAVGVDVNSEHAKTGQYLGGVLIMKKNEHLMKYLAEYEKVIRSDPRLCTDFYNTSNQCSEFEDNRHDQSISSLLRKKMGSVVIDGDESWIPPFGRGESLRYPFWAIRSKT
jgi:hypothetical protein